jgi:preprotein translocase subunit YajC
LDPTPLLFIALLAFGYLVLRRGSRQRRDAAAVRSSVSVGAHVMTTSGLFATVVSVDDEAITLETGPGQRSRWDRRAVARVLDAAPDLSTSSTPSAQASGNAPEHPGGVEAAAEAADSSPTVAPSAPEAAGSTAPDLLTEPPAASPVRSSPDLQPPSDETNPRGSA